MQVGIFDVINTGVHLGSCVRAGGGSRRLYTYVVSPPRKDKPASHQGKAWSPVKPAALVQVIKILIIARVPNIRQGWLLECFCCTDAVQFSWRGVIEIPKSCQPLSSGNDLHGYYINITTAEINLMDFDGPVRNEKRKHCLSGLFERLLIEQSHQKLVPRHHDGSSFPDAE